MEPGVEGPGSGQPATSSAPAGACAGAGLTPTAGDLDRVRAATLCLVNRERAERGEGALRLSAKLERIAQSYSREMVLGNYFNDVAPDGETPVSRMSAVGYLESQREYEVGENIAWGSLSLATPQAIVAAWMASPGHRENILNARFRDTAVGVYPAGPASLSGGLPAAVYTQEFGVIIAA